MGKRGPKPGQYKRPAGAGRKKGSTNKLTADIKAAIEEAFGKAGGAKYLYDLSKSDPRTFCGLLGKILPTTVAGDPENPLGVVAMPFATGVERDGDPEPE